MNDTLAAPGTVLVSTWGYDQTNVDFFEVTRATRHTLWLRPIAVKRGETTTDLSGYVLPQPGKYIGAELRRRPIAGAADLRVAIDSVAHARPWDGAPVHETRWA